MLRVKDELRAAAAAEPAAAAAGARSAPGAALASGPAELSRAQRAAAAAAQDSAGPAPGAAPRLRAARVNLMRGSVAEALAWLRAPPEPHARHAHPVSAPAGCPCPSCAPPAVCCCG